jgi:hypothetical protein
MEVRQQKLGLTIHGIPLEDMDISDEASKRNTWTQLEQHNGIEITGIKPLRQKARTTTNRRHQSITIFTSQTEAANRCLKTGFYINRYRYYPEKYAPQYRITQCFNCQGYGHRAAECKGKQTCGRCSGEHRTDECNSDKESCAGCQGEHAAWHHECPKRKAISKELEEAKRKGNAFFNE